MSRFFFSRIRFNPYRVRSRRSALTSFVWIERTGRGPSGTFVKRRRSTLPLSQSEKISLKWSSPVSHLSDTKVIFEEKVRQREISNFCQKVSLLWSVPSVYASVRVITCCTDFMTNMYYFCVLLWRHL